MTKWLLVLVLCLPGLTWLSTVGDPLDYWRYEVPAGQFPYLLSKLVGLYAVVAFWLQLLYGLLGARGREVLKIERGNRFHRRLGIIVLLLVVAHFMLFVLAASLRTDHFASQYLVPSFAHGYYRSIITIGLAGAGLVIVGTLFGLARQWIGHVWRFVHWVLCPAFLAAVVHSLLIGSESRISPMKAQYIVMIVTMIAAVAVRLEMLRPFRAPSRPEQTG